MRIFFRASFLVLVVAVAACGKSEPEAEPIAPVKAAPAIRGSIREIVTADAVLYPRDQANITPKIAAPVKRFLVSRGDVVKKGQLLVELENADLTAAAAESRGQYGQAQSNYRSITEVEVPEQLIKAQTDFDAAKQAADAAQRVLESREELFKDGALARKAVDEAQVASVQAKGQLATADQHLKSLQAVAKDEQTKNAAAQVDAAKGHYDTATAQLSYSQIVSPIDGVVTDRPAYAGEMAATGTPLLTVMDTSVIVARANLSLLQAKDVKVGDEATVTPSDGGDAVEGKVTTVSPAVDANSTTVQVWVQVDNRDGALRAGGSGRVAIVARTIDGATLVPATAILPSDEGGSKVLVVDDKEVAHEKPVQTGATENGQVQITGGLEPGERVITVGGLGLDDKAKVHVLKPGEKLPGQADEKDDDDEDAK
jgi:multidrug efflux pump subunit AcrA (membrane-fusion protein)